MRSVEIAIVGAGPAGLAATAEAVACGAKVTLIDDNRQPGGQYFRQIAGQFRRKATTVFDKDQPRSEAFADFVADGHAASEHDGERRQAPALLRQGRQEGLQQRRGMVMDGRGREPVGDHDGRIVIALDEFCARFRVQNSAQVGATEVGLAVAGCAGEEDVRRLEARRIEDLIDGVPGAGMIELEAQQLGSRQAVAGAAERDAGGCERSQVNSHGVASRSGRCSSQASNSGAGFNPRTERRYRASWKLVLW